MALSESEELELLQLQKQKAMSQQNSKHANPPLGFVAKQMFGMLPQVKATQWAIKNPQTVLPMSGAAIGSAIAPGAGTAAGAGLGQIGSRMIDIAKGAPVQSPGKEAIGPMVQAFAGGLPEVSGVLKPGPMTLAQRTGKALSRAGETLSGAKQSTLEEAFRKGYRTYSAPSMEQAQNVFSEALGPEGRAAMKQTASEVFDPQLSQSRSIATEIGTKIEQGKEVSAIEALKARQATDDIISSTSPTDKNKLNALYKWRTLFDNELSGQSGKLANASRTYRSAIVKDTLLNPTRITKSGRPSAFLPMIFGAGGRGPGGVLAGLTGTSPLAWGLGATTLGSINPTLAKSGLAEIIQKMLQQDKPSPPQGSGLQ